jgi:hypothetical protein
MIKYICDKCEQEVTDTADVVQYGQNVWHKGTCWLQLTGDELRKVLLPNG